MYNFPRKTFNFYMFPPLIIKKLKTRITCFQNYVKLCMWYDFLYYNACLATKENFQDMN